MIQNPQPEQEKSIARPPVEPWVFSREPESKYREVIGELWSILREVHTSPKRYFIYLFASLLVAVLLINMTGQVYLNRWQGEFFSAVGKQNTDLVFHTLLVFIPLVTGLLCVVVSQTWLHERLKISIRDWITNDLLDRWLAPARAYRLAITSDSGVNPDQRIQEDTRNFSEMTTDLTIGLTQSLLLLASFIGVLWGMSSNIHFNIRDTTIDVPGYMVWVAILYAIAGSWITAKVGKPLIKLNEERYTREADFRFSIVRVSENSESIGFYSGESDERKIINRNLNSVLGVMKKLSFALAKLTWVTSSYGWLMIVLPVIVALPGYLQGALDLGGLMMVVGAFNQVQQSLRWFVDNFARIADWRAALHRVTVFRDALNFIDTYENEEEQIELLPHGQGHLAFHHTKINLIDGAEVIADATAYIVPGERVLLEGPSGSGKSTLFRAMGGLWPWGSGKIYVPPRYDMMFLPQRSYMPPGTLAQVLVYPKRKGEFALEDMQEALRKVNLEEFIPALHQSDRWDKLMSLGQQQRIAFARLLLHKPKWVFLDEATSALDEANELNVMSFFTNELKESTLVSIGHRPGLATFHTRIIKLIATQAGVVLRRRTQKKKMWNFSWHRKNNKKKP